MALENEKDSNTAYEETVKNIESKEMGRATRPSFGQMMSERKTVSRWFVALTFMIGAFCGTCLGVVFMWLAFVAS